MIPSEASFLMLLALIFGSVAVFVGFILWWLRIELRGEA